MHNWCWRCRMDVRMRSRRRRDGRIGRRSRSGVFGRVRGWIGNLNWVRNLHRYLDVLLADILHSRMALFFIKGLLNQLVVGVTFLFLCWCTLFFWDVGVCDIATLVDEGFAPVDNFGSVPRHSDRVALDFHRFFALFSCPRLKPCCLTFFQVV